MTENFLLRITGGARCPHWTILSLWILGIGIMLGLTIKDSCKLVGAYLDEEANTEVQIRVSSAQNDNDTLASVYLCVPLPPRYDYSNLTKAFLKFTQIGNASSADWNGFYKSCPICKDLDSNGWNIWKENAPLFTGILNKSLAPGMADFHYPLAFPVHSSQMFAKKLIEKKSNG